jgi:asparagine synthase (glutamine-hydrolysing)
MFLRRDPVTADTLHKATKSLYHRGPDGQRHWIGSETELARIVVKGEFYDYEATQQALERSGHRLRTRSDSEIALLQERFHLAA